MGVYDVPAQLKEVANVSGSNKKIILIGYSLGTAISFVYASEKRNDAISKLAAVIALGPVTMPTSLVKRFRYLDTVGTYLMVKTAT